jgi:DNA-binding transcriptional MerR regulator
VPVENATYTVEELAARTGETTRALRYWIERGVLPRPEFRGRATRYGREHELVIRAIHALKAQRRTPLAEIKRRLAKATIEQLEQIAGVKKALPAAPPPPPPAPNYPCERWDYVPLLPGLELRVRTDGPEILRRIAMEIRAHYGST